MQDSNKEYYLNLGDNVVNMVTGEQYRIIRIDRKEDIVIGENEREKRAFGKGMTYSISCLVKVKNN